MAEVFEGLTIELGPVVSDNDLRHFEYVNDEFPREFFNVGGLDIGK